MSTQWALKHGLQRHVSDELWSAFLAGGEITHFRPRAMLVRQGEMSPSMLVLVQGRVKVLAADENGSDQLLAIRTAGDLVGELGDGGTARTATVIAMDPCVAYRITHRKFHGLLAKHDAYIAYSDYLTDKALQNVPYQVRLRHFPPRQRIARLLLDIAALGGPELPDRMRIPCSLGTLAKALGLERGTVAVQVSSLRVDGALRPGPGLAVADMTRLRHAAGIAHCPR